MTFRGRLAIGGAALVVLVVAAVGLAARAALTAALEADFAGRADAAMARVRASLAEERDGIRDRLDELGRVLAEDNAFRLAWRAGQGSAVADWAVEAMSVAGLDALFLLDAEGAIVSAGHFRNAYGQSLPGLAGAIRTADQPPLVRFRLPDGSLVGIAAAQPVEVAGATFHLVGGRQSEPTRYAAVDGEELRIRFEFPGWSTGDPLLVQGVLAEITVPYLVPGDDGVAVDVGRVVVQHGRQPLLRIRRALDRALLLTAGLGALVAALLGWWLAGRLAAPVTRLASDAASVGAADGTPVFSGTEREDEIGALARTLDAMTRRLMAAAQQLRNAERRAAVGDVARQVNHDVKNGLVPIRNVLRHLGETAEREPDRLAEVFAARRDTLDSAVDYLEQLARRYAQLSPRIARGTTDLRAVVRRVAEAEGVAADVVGEAPMVQGDEVAVRRIVENLVRNAVEVAGADGVSVTVTTGRDGVRLAVEDRGPGMDRATLNRAFEDFYTTKPDGAGLGLTVVRRVVRDLGGDLKVQTEPGSGTTVAVTLPPYRPPAVPPGGVEGGAA